MIRDPRKDPSWYLLDNKPTESTADILLLLCGIASVLAVGFVWWVVS